MGFVAIAGFEASGVAPIAPAVRATRGTIVGFVAGGMIAGLDFATTAGFALLGEAGIAGGRTRTVTAGRCVASGGAVRFAALSPAGERGTVRSFGNGFDDFMLGAMRAAVGDHAGSTRALIRSTLA